MGCCYREPLRDWLACLELADLLERFAWLEPLEPPSWSERAGMTILKTFLFDMLRTFL